MCGKGRFIQPRKSSIFLKKSHKKIQSSCFGKSEKSWKINDEFSSLKNKFSDSKSILKIQQFA
jgi:hypothetical protein